MDIKPSKQEIKDLNMLVREFLKKLNSKLKGAKAIAGGSFAKNTFLRGNNDIDIFVQFNKDKDISDKLEKVIQKIFKDFSRVHGSRDYFHVYYKNILFEIVPVLKISRAGQAENVTDVSPLHIRYVKKYTNAKLQDEIRLLKQFFKANNLYGAESYIKGFSGYVTELLIIHYKSFNRLIKNVKTWKGKTIIDISKKYKDKKEVLKKLNISKTYSPLILVDPVRKDRNAAASLSKEKYDLFIKLAKRKKLNFKVKEFKPNKLKNYILLEILPLKGKKDIVGAKMLKAFQYIEMNLNENGFLVKDSGWHWNDKAYFFFKVKDNLSKKRKHYGPRMDQEAHIKRFKTKYNKLRFLKQGNKIYVILPRRFTKAKDLIKSILKDKNVKLRVKKIKIV